MSDTSALYRMLYLIRRAEEEIARIYPTDKIKSPVHLAIGQEAIATGVCAALAPRDVVFGTYRSHAVYLAKGGDLNAMMAELYGKVTGCARGKGGSMHLIDVGHGVMGTSAIVATTIPHAVGYAWAMRQQGKDAVVAVFFGDGATEAGVFHESLNFAKLKELPVLFVCENNQLAIHARQSARQAKDNIWERAQVYGIESVRLEQDDVLRVHDTARSMVDRMRAGGGPGFMECRTFRWYEHVGPGEDWALGYRQVEEAQPWIENDQVKRLAGMLDAGTRGAIEAEVEAALAASIEFAESSPFPGPEELYTDLLAEEKVATWTGR